METAENELLKREVETLKRENAELRETNNKLKLSLGKASRRRPNKPQPVATAYGGVDTELQQKLNRTTKQLSDVQERLTLLEQVNAATQRRELRQEGALKNLPSDSFYEELRFDPTEEYVYTRRQLITHTDVLRAQYWNLTIKLDAHIVAVRMYERNALTLRDLQSIQSLRESPVEAAETLLNIIMEQSDAVYLCFLDVLKHTGQQHIYQTLVEDGYRDYDDQSSHTSVIRAHYVFLLETLDVKFSGLLDQLCSDQVVSAAERDDISAERTSFRANEKLLSVLSRKSPQQFQLFFDALDNCGQLHVRNAIYDRRGVLGTLSGNFATVVEGGCNDEQDVHTLPEGPPVYGVTTLGEQVYVLRRKERDQVEVYDVIAYRLRRCLTVPYARAFADMTSCVHCLCLYISDPGIRRIHRLGLGLRGNAIRWPVSEEPWGLSVNAAHNLLVTCPYVRKIKEFSPRGELLRDVTLPDDVIQPGHVIQLTSGQFIVCHGRSDDPVHRVCTVSADGHEIVRSHGGQPGSDTGQYDVPSYLAVDNGEFVFVADLNNQRVTLLSPTLNYMREVVSSEQVKWKPGWLRLDVERRRLYVADTEWTHGKSTVGRVVVFNV